MPSRLLIAALAFTLIVQTFVPSNPQLVWQYGIALVVIGPLLLGWLALSANTRLWPVIIAAASEVVLYGVAYWELAVVDPSQFKSISGAVDGFYLAMQLLSTATLGHPTPEGQFAQLLAASQMTTTLVVVVLALQVVLGSVKQRSEDKEDEDSGIDCEAQGSLSEPPSDEVGNDKIADKAEQHGDHTTLLPRKSVLALVALAALVGGAVGGCIGSEWPRRRH